MSSAAAEDEDIWDEVHSEAGTDEETVADVQEQEELELALHSIHQTGGKQHPVRKRGPSKEEREQAADVHRLSCLILTARALQLDHAACDPEVQAIAMSRLDPSLFRYINPQFETQRAVNCLKPVVSGLQDSWLLSQEQDMDMDDADATQSILQQVHAAVSGASASPEQLVVIFVALMRACGYAARIVRLLDGAPLMPWKKPPKAVQAKTKKVAKPAPLQQLSKEPSNIIDGSASAGGKRRKRKSGEGSSSGAAATKAAATEHQEAAKAEPSTTKRRKGDDEFEAQLRMAMLATEAEETARRAAAVADTTTRAVQRVDERPSAPPTTVRAMRAALMSAKAAAGTQQAGDAGSRGGRGGGGRGRGKGRGQGPTIVVAVQECVVCWAEVWCGSAEYGRWVHVDVVHGLVDKPESVAQAVAAAGGHAAASGCIVGCDHGSVRDVTTRYLTNTLAVKKARDNEWWDATMSKLQRQPIQFPTPSLAVLQAPAIGNLQTGSGAGSSQARAASMHATHQPSQVPSIPAAQKEQPRQQQPAQAAGLTQEQLEAGTAQEIHAAIQQQPQAQEAPVQQQQQTAAQQQHAAALQQRQLADVQRAASLREQREAAELNHKLKAGMSNLPTSIDGFQNHPLYVLQRHVTKYQALMPGTQPLGLHKGEPYYPRDALSELHTAERWRREGWKVRDDELSTPVKEVKKRAKPARRLQPRYGGGRNWVASAYAATLPTADSQGTASAVVEGSFKRSSSNGGGVVQEGQEAEEEGGEEGGADAAAEGEPLVKLYGRWQADPFLARAEDGKVPRNERGNVEVPPLAPAVPIGCVHLQYPGLPPICRSLDVDFAPALVGFELQGGRMLPKFDGVVVCEEHEQQVVAAYVERETKRQAAAQERHEREMRAAWLQLLQALHMRLQLADDYSVGGDHQAGVGVGGGSGSKGYQRGRKNVGQGEAGDEEAGRQSAMQQAVMERLLREEQEAADGRADKQQDQLEEEEI